MGKIQVSERTPSKNLDLSSEGCYITNLAPLLWWAGEHEWIWSNNDGRQYPEWWEEEGFEPMEAYRNRTCPKQPTFEIPKRNLSIRLNGYRFRVKVESNQMLLNTFYWVHQKHKFWFFKTIRKERVGLVFWVKNGPEKCIKTIFNLQ